MQEAGNATGVGAADIDDAVRFRAVKMLMGLTASTENRPLRFARERELLDLIRRGVPAAEICDVLDISIDTLIACLWRLSR